MTTNALPKQFVEVNGRRHRIYLDGARTPTVVFEPAIGDVGLTWGLRPT